MELAKAAWSGGFKNSDIKTATDAIAKAIAKEPRMQPSTVEQLARETAKLQTDKQLKDIVKEKEKIMDLLKKSKQHLNNIRKLQSSPKNSKYKPNVTNNFDFSDDISDCGTQFSKELLPI